MTHTKHCQDLGTFAAIAGLVGGLLAVTPTATAQASAEVPETIPTHLALPADPEEYPDPICLGCKIITRRPTSAGGANAHGILSVAYDDDERPTFVGDVVLTVFLHETHERRVTALFDVSLADDETVELLVPPGEDWAWGDVQAVWVELLPAS
jgi:hypothetical protein